MDLTLNERDLKEILAFIYKRKGIDLSSYRQNFLLRRLSFRAKACGLKNGREYISLIEKDDGEFSRMLDTLSINVTEFFRDPEVFEAFRKIALDELIRRKSGKGHKVIRAWSAGCASGEEPYSLAIAINEELRQRREDFVVRIWATDVDNAALADARKAEYRIGSLKSMEKGFLLKYFQPCGNDTYKLEDSIREMVNFRHHNLLADEPLKFMDVIFCRNVMIYLTQKEHNILFQKFNRALNSGGYMVIGKVEAVWSNVKDYFTAADSRQKIYQKAG